MNTPATFQHFLNDVLQDILYYNILVYFDNILIFSNNSKKHNFHTRTVLERLWQHDLYAKLEKCTFNQTTIELLDFILSPEGIKMDTYKIQAVCDWAIP